MFLVLPFLCSHLHGMARKKSYKGTAELIIWRQASSQYSYVEIHSHKLGNALAWPQHSWRRQDIL
jgi:hypothetical protein